MFFVVVSFSPYSNFKVGAAIRLRDGSIVGGCNIENSAYSPTICAERTAACKAISSGYTEFKAVAVIGFQEEAFTTPCGVCRQFLSEFVKEDIPIYVSKPSPNRVLVTSMKSLLPMGFGLLTSWTIKTNESNFCYLIHLSFFFDIHQYWHYSNCTMLIA